MHKTKQVYANRIMKLVESSCIQVTRNNPYPVERALYLKRDASYDVIKKIIIALPEPFFHQLPTPFIEDFIKFISSNYLLFEAQENYESEYYEDNLMNFIHVLSKDIGDRYFHKERSCLE